MGCISLRSLGYRLCGRYCLFTSFPQRQGNAENGAVVEEAGDYKAVCVVCIRGGEDEAVLQRHGNTENTAVVEREEAE